MELLAVAPHLYRIHHNVLRGHKRQLAAQMFLNDLRIHHQAVHHIQAQIQNPVHRQKGLRNGQTLVGRVVQGPLKPLAGGGDSRIQRVNHHIPGQRGDPLAPHGIALIGHGGRTDLPFLKGLLHLLQVLQQPDVIAHLVGGSPNARKHIGHPGVHLSGIRLAGHRETLLKAHLLRNHGIDPIHLLLVPVKKFQEGGLGACGPFGSQKFHTSQAVVQIFQIQTELLQPQRRPFSHRGGLGRLKMSERQSGLGLVFFCKIPQHRHHIHKLFLHKPQSLGHNNNVRVVPHIAGSSPQMNNARRLRALLPVCVHMAHNVMTDLPLPLPGHIVIDLLRVIPHLLDLFHGDNRLPVPAQTKFHLRLRQGNPQLPPGPELHIR